MKRLLPGCASKVRSFDAVIEALEARIAPATFLVTTLADAGDGSLRDAITKANAEPGRTSSLSRKAARSCSRAAFRRLQTP
jgi:hypothetical protein